MAALALAALERPSRPGPGAPTGGKRSRGIAREARGLKLVVGREVYSIKARGLRNLTLSVPTAGSRRDD